MTGALRGAAAMWVIAWRANRPKMSVALGLIVLSGLSWPLFALSLNLGTDAMIAGDVGTATIAALAMSVTAIGALMCNHFAYVPYAEATELAVVSLEADLIRLATDSARLEHFERPEFADKFALVQEEISGFSFGMIGLMAMVSLTISVAFTGVLLASVSPWLLLLTLAALPPLFTAQRAQQIVEEGKENSARARRQAAHVLALSTSPGSAMELRVLRLQREMRRRHRAHWAVAGDLQWRAERRAMVIGAAGQLTFAAAYVAAVLLVVHQAIAGSSQAGDVFLVVVLAAQVNQQVNAGLEQFRRLRRLSAGLARFAWLRAAVAERTAEPVAAAQVPAPVPVPDRIRTGIELRHLGFRYPGAKEPVLHDVDIALPAGSLVAIVGENGAGKTTLVKLLCRLYEPTEGYILLDGIDIRRHPVAQWHGRIAAGFQDFARLEVPARQTVGVGDLPLVDDEAAVRSALDRAHSGDVVQRLERGLRTHLGKTYKDGAELSGGQWQKLALGRAMMRATPMLLVLDEPTSALDAQAEHQLFERYGDNARRAAHETGAITVLVSHRFSTVSMADIILVIDGGRIVEAGDHAALLSRGGLYAELFAIQAAAYDTRRHSPPRTEYRGDA
ncbi:MAG TPA: ABC transporter ATP-binding protein [Streptosporangiaceae bacterium]|nr:ABC transporter ATP-binding protein [Streptosporangiaceae bacterium]